MSHKNTIFYDLTNDIHIYLGWDTSVACLQGLETDEGGEPSIAIPHDCFARLCRQYLVFYDLIKAGQDPLTAAANLPHD